MVKSSPSPPPFSGTGCLDLLPSLAHGRGTGTERTSPGLGGPPHLGTVPPSHPTWVLGSQLHAPMEQRRPTACQRDWSIGPSPVYEEIDMLSAVAAFSRKWSVPPSLCPEKNIYIGNEKKRVESLVPWSMRGDKSSRGANGGATAGAGAVIEAGASVLGKTLNCPACGMDTDQAKAFGPGVWSEQSRSRTLN